MTDPRFTDQEYADLLAWFMASDPFPLEAEPHDRIQSMLNDEAEARGYGDSWVAAYHDLHMKEAPQ